MRRCAQRRRRKGKTECDKGGMRNVQKKKSQKALGLWTVLGFDGEEG